MADEEKTEQPADENDSNLIDESELAALLGQQGGDDADAADEGGAAAAPDADAGEATEASAAGSDVEQVAADAEALAAEVETELAQSEDMQSLADEMAAALAAEAEAAGGEKADADGGPPKVVGSTTPHGGADPSEFKADDFADGEVAAEPAQLDLLDDVELNVKIELGRTDMYIEDVLRLDIGSVVELDKLAGDPVDILVNDQFVARGEVLVLNDNFCVRINQIISPIPELEEGRP